MSKFSGKWTEDVVDYVRAHCHSMSDGEMAKRITFITGVRTTKVAVYDLRMRLLISKHAEWSHEPDLD